ncbi:hypothetical protein CALVIDRAFT_557661 [Calocera viscosa TUFC12733]|uniref:Gti1/Pac2 family-domain-containing protein n=1 Tax=Calocera viscosa (strain TUFC12733) TaxID=1330018 RepID=A0A167I3T7_CALVF|nr:hypothetical protein CALVIDRAFT_557661 [Calocera viscosa TUFC12733]
MPPRLQYQPLSGIWAHDTLDALVVVEAVRTGVIQALDRRLTREEARDLVKSGNLFIYHEGDSGIKRWTDSYRWTDSRIKYNYLIYAQKEGKANERRGAEIPAELYTAGGTRLSPADIRSLVECVAGPLPDESGYIDPDSTLKKTITIVTGSGETYRLVSYFTLREVMTGFLVPAHLHPWLKGMEPSREGMAHSTLRFMPRGEKRPGDDESDLSHYAYAGISLIHGLLAHI